MVEVYGSNDLKRVESIRVAADAPGNTSTIIEIDNPRMSE